MSVFIIIGVAKATPAKGISLSAGGMVELENYFATEHGESFDEISKKNEARLKLFLKAGSDNLFFYAVPDFYISSSYFSENTGNDSSYRGNQTESGFSRTSSDDTEMKFNELYLHYGFDNFQIRAGNQIISWGTADVFNPTSYFNPADMRETFAMDVDDVKTGVPALSGIVYFDNYTAEGVWVPVHVTADRAANDEFWALSPENYTFPVKFSADKRLESTPENYGYGLRLTTTAGAMDLSASYYHGPDNEPVYVPDRTEYNGDNPLAIYVSPEYYVVDKYGIDFARQYRKFVFQFEIVYCPDRRGVVKQDLFDSNAIVLPYTVDETESISYTAGFNYFIPVADYFPWHDGEMIFTFEWFDVIYLNDTIMDPVMSEFAGLQLEDTFFDGRFSLKCSSLIDTKYNGMLVWPEAGYNFENGFSVEMSYMLFEGKRQMRNKEASVFNYLESSDIFIFKVKYEF